jgi:hypothetical protein
MEMPQLTVMQQALLRYYGNAIWCIDHVTKENLTCHNTNEHKNKNQDICKKTNFERVYIEGSPVTTHKSSRRDSPEYHHKHITDVIS